MGVRLTVKRRAEAGGAEKPQVVTLTEDTITIGRDDGCDVVLAQSAVSRNHARIVRDDTLFFVAAGAIGFTLVLILFAVIRERLETCDVPSPFKGTSIAMITAGLMSLAFMGFSGVLRIS
jgi:Na+-translocating ferredoxin:NAD+ oxidoreductase RnfA subunit